ncbi:MAG: hypothetical protein GX446_13935 [Chthonomonadales bacterium]|nr:hypothetical protein [Chthonomonadales bacterium]
MEERNTFTRRELLGTSAIAAGSVMSGGLTSGIPSPPAAGEQVERIPSGKIGNVTIGRMLLGGNLIGGWLHCRDLKYVGQLFRAYCTEEKILQTIALAEKHGINTVFETGGDFVQRHNRATGGKMQFIPHIEVDADRSEQALRDHIKAQADTGAVALYVWGVSSDRLVYTGHAAKLVRAVELARETGLPIGVGTHSLTVVKECERLKAPVDFYVKTLHRDDYPSATPRERRKDFMWMTGEGGYYDNMWCIDADETIAFMKQIAKPWIAFKVLAAGAYLPRDGFQYAFANGADFIAVGMFDFQIADNCATLNKTLAANARRERRWFG